MYPLFVSVGSAIAGLDVFIKVIVAIGDESTDVSKDELSLPSV